MSSHKLNHDAAQRELRRQKVAANLLAGLTYREIASALEIALGTVSNEKVILGRWQREQVVDVSLYIDIECRRLDMALNAIWGKVQNGDMSAIDRMLAIMNRRARYKGYDQSIIVEGKGKDGAFEVTFISNVDDDRL